MKTNQKGLSTPLLVTLVAVIVLALGFFIYKNKGTAPAVSDVAPQTQTNVKGNTGPDYTPPQTSTQTNTVAAPEIALLTSSTATIGSTMTIKGTNLDPLGAYSGIGWLTHSHIFVRINDVSGERGYSGILWEGGAQGKNTVNADGKITFTIPSQTCQFSEVGAGGCPDGLATLTPGVYNIVVTVDGRGESNKIPVTISTSNINPIINSVQPNPVSIGQQFIVNGVGFAYQRPAQEAGNGWFYRTGAMVAFKNSQGKKIDVYSIPRGQNTNDSQIVFSIPQSGCDDSRNEIDCTNITIRPGNYIVSVWTAKGWSNEIPLKIE